jgi:hypothetical protein
MFKKAGANSLEVTNKIDGGDVDRDLLGVR